MKVLSLFSGIGAFEKALDRLGIPYELVGYCEIDKYASKSYAAIHGVDESMNLGDITKIDEMALPKDIDLITYGFPCQDISLAGKQKGLFNEDGTQTRSGLFFEALRIIEETQPRVAIAENVKNLTSKKFAEQFKIVLDSLEAAGYNNYWKVLNAKDYGIPQNRERVFIVSIRKDIDNGEFKFPEGFPLQLRLKDMLEDEVDEKYYISKKMIQYIENASFKQDANCIQDSDICETLRVGGTRPCIRMETDELKTSPIRLGNVYGDQFGASFGGNVWDKNGVAPTLKTTAAASQQHVIVGEPKVVQVGNVNPSGKGQNGTVVDSEGLARTITQEKGEGQKILVREATKQGYAEAEEGDSINIAYPNSKTRRGRVQKQMAGTLTTSAEQAVVLSEPTIQRVDIPQTVKVRKYPVDCKALCECLRDHKIDSCFNNKEIAGILNVPQTKVEHWFRRDDCFAIPDPEIWMQLKLLLKIETNEFDESIMTFEEREGVYEKSERHYHEDGIMPTLTSTTAGSEKIIVSAAMRGRYNTEGKIGQNIEVSDREVANAITTVQKDSLVAECDANE